MSTVKYERNLIIVYHQNKCIHLTLSVTKYFCHCTIYLYSFIYHISNDILMSNIIEHKHYRLKMKKNISINFKFFKNHVSLFTKYLQKCGFIDIDR